MRRFISSDGAMLLAATLALVGGCGYGHLQTARPTPKGALDVAVGQGFLYNKTVQLRADEEGGSGVAIANVPFMVGTRVGLTDRLDLGLRLFLVAGAMVDTKVNVLSPQSRWAMSFSLGFGAAKDLGDKDGALVHIPIGLHLSYDFKCGLTPYAAVGYSFYWIYGRDAEPIAGAQYLDRAGHGDHLVTATFGLQLKLNRIAALLVEYNLWQPVVDDPGDFFSFERSHIALVGVRFRFPVSRHYRLPPPKRRPLPPPRDPGPAPLPPATAPPPPPTTTPHPPPATTPLPRPPAD